jgi:hypothetical protein
VHVSAIAHPVSPSKAVSEVSVPVQPAVLTNRISSCVLHQFHGDKYEEDEVKTAALISIVTLGYVICALFRYPCPQITADSSVMPVLTAVLWRRIILPPTAIFEGPCLGVISDI